MSVNATVPRVLTAESSHRFWLRIGCLAATLDSSLDDLGLRGMHSEICCSTAHFLDSCQSYWMPVSAIIDVETPRQHWRNVQRFTAYKRFKATIRVEDIEKKQ